MRLYIILFVCVLTIHGFAQNKTDSVRHVRALGKASPEGVKLRWGVTDATTWKLANKYGYTIDRYTVIRDSKLLPKTEKVRLSPALIKPAPQAAWEKAIDNDDFAAIAAQAIFGDSFEATTGQSNDVAQVINKSKELEQRFSFALFAADHSFAAARLSGLAWTDSTARNNEKYLYKIYVNVPKSVLNIDTGLVYISRIEKTELPKPVKVVGQFGNKVVNLRWPIKFLRSSYSSYRIERSEDNINFSPTSKLPFVNTDSRAASADYFTKLDSLPQNDKTYYLRIRGIDAFGDAGPPSDVVKGAGVDPIHCDIAISKGLENKAGLVDLQWKVACEAESVAKDVIGYEVSRSARAEGPYVALTKKVLGVSVNNYQDALPLATNYYVVTMIAKGERRKTSFPFMVQLADSIPPATPQGLTARIDTTGIVTLHWTANTEKDLLGYRVYRSNFEKSEFGMITVSPIREANYQDTINIRTLTRKIFYKVVSEDTRNNRSAFSVVVSLERPDKIPPMPPIIKSIESTNSGVVVRGIPSSSEDVVKQVLVRRVAKGAWLNVKLFSRDSLYYVDNSAEAGRGAEYGWQAIDGNGNISVLSPTAYGKIPTVIRPGVDKFTASPNRANHTVELKWEANSPDVLKYLVYRSTGELPMSMYKTLGKEFRVFSDENVKDNTRYVYRIKAIFADGSESQFSKEALITY